MTEIDQCMSPQVTVLLPVRNGRKTLRAAVRSLVLQTYTSMEVLVLDDGSTDGSVEIAEEFNDPRIRVIRDGLHTGLATRLNEGIDLARGKYIARMDADDVAFPERFLEQVRYLERHPNVDLLGSRAIVFRSADDVIGLLPFRADHSEICARPCVGIPLAHPTWMGKTAWFRQHRYRSPEVLRAEDQELLLRAAPASRYACLDKVLLGYRQHPFALHKVLLARRQLLAAQWKLFVQRDQWSNACCAVVMGSVKMAVDLLCALPGGNRLFFARMSFAYEPAHLQALQAALQIEK
jgi:glycosyltransferase involved in cell wall biosynthesis